MGCPPLLTSQNQDICTWRSQMDGENVGRGMSELTDLALPKSIDTFRSIDWVPRFNISTLS